MEYVEMYNVSWEAGSNWRDVDQSTSTRLTTSTSFEFQTCHVSQSSHFFLLLISRGGGLIISCLKVIHIPNLVLLLQSKVPYSCENITALATT